MAGKIKGITIEFNGDTRKLDKALKNVEDTSKGLTKELKEIDRSLKFNPGNAKLLKQQQRVLGEEVKNTAEKLEILKNAAKEAEKALSKGDIDQGTFDELTREIIKTGNQLERYKNKLSDSEKEEERLKKATERLGTFFTATETDINDFAETVGVKLVKAYKDGQADSKQLNQIIDKLGEGFIGAEGYIEEFRKKLDKIKGKSIGEVGDALKDLKKEAYNANTTIDDTQRTLIELGSLDGLRESVSDLFGAIAAGAQELKGVFEDALGKSETSAKIDFTMDLDEESKEVVTDAMIEIKKYGIDGEEALEAVRRQWALNGDATDEQNRKVIESAAAIAYAYEGIDITELIQEANELAQGIGISDEEALALYHSLMKAGLPPEEIDIVAEYGAQLKMAGYNAEEINAIMASAATESPWNVDNLLDGIKEGRVRMTEFGESVSVTMEGLLSKTDMSSESFQALGTKIASGGEEGKNALNEVAAWLETIEDDTTKNTIGVEVFGTKWEDQGSAITNTLLGMEDHLTTTEAMTGSLADATSDIESSPTVELKNAFLQLHDALAPLYEKLSWLVSKLAEFVEAHPKVSAAIAVIAGVLGILIPIIIALTGVVLTFNTVMVAGQVALAPIIFIIAAIIAIIAGLVAAITYYVKHWDEKVAEAKEIIRVVLDWFKENVAPVFESIRDTILSVWTTIRDNTIAVWDAITGKITAVWDAIKTVVVIVVTAVKDKITSIWDSIKSKTTAVWNGIKNAIKAPFEAARDIVKGVIDKIKGFFDFEFKWPTLKLPHFSVKPAGWEIGDLLKGDIPSLGISWHSQGGIFTKPTLLQSANGALHGVGEAGAEAIIPLERLQDMINKSNTINQRSMETAMYKAMSQAMRELNINMVIDKREFGRLMGE